MYIRLICPGFRGQYPPLKKITIKGFSKHLRNEIVKLKLDNYIVSGVSFGFWVLNNTKLTKGCRGVIAIEPYVNSKCLNSQRISGTKRTFYRPVIKIILFLRLEKIIWDSRVWRKHYLGLSGYRAKRSKIILREIDPKTFFVSAYMILGNSQKATLHDLPHVLVFNPSDLTLDMKFIQNFFKKNSWRLMLINTKIGHYPRKVTKGYFQKKISRDDIRRIYEFFDSYDG